MLRYLIAFLIFLHDMAHISGFIANWTTKDVGFPDRPWILPGGFRLHSPVGKAWGLLWLVGWIGLVGAALGLVFGQPWWPALAVSGAVISLVAILPW